MLDALTLDQIRTFVAIADSGSFRSAAHKLSRVQSGVSATIANLEDTLGVKLFDRSGYKPALTAQGQVLLGNARDIILRVDVLRCMPSASVQSRRLRPTFNAIDGSGCGRRIRTNQAAQPERSGGRAQSSDQDVRPLKMEVLTNSDHHIHG